MKSHRAMPCPAHSSHAWLRWAPSLPQHPSTAAHPPVKGSRCPPPPTPLPVCRGSVRCRTRAGAGVCQPEPRASQSCAAATSTQLTQAAIRERSPKRETTISVNHLTAGTGAQPARRHRGCQGSRYSRQHTARATALASPPASPPPSTALTPHTPRSIATPHGVPKAHPYPTRSHLCVPPPKPPPPQGQTEVSR